MLDWVPVWYPQAFNHIHREREVLSLALCPGPGWLQVIKSIQKLGETWSPVQGTGGSDF